MEANFSLHGLAIHAPMYMRGEEQSLLMHFRVLEEFQIPSPYS